MTHLQKGWREKRKKKRRKKNKDKRGESRAGSLKKAAPVNVCSKWRMDVIGQPSQRGSTACFQRALNYASLSFHQPHTGRQIKDASAEVLPSQLSQS